MEIGYKYNLKTETDPPQCEWLTVPNFRLRQTQVSQFYLDRAQELKASGYKLHGHPLIDLRQRIPPEYVADFLPFLRGLTAGFEEVIDAWDVTNEMANHGADVWGDYWQATVFEAMREIAPNAQLYMNEYAIQNAEYWDGVLSLAQRLKADGLIDGVGIQCRADITNRIPSAFDYGASLLLQPLPAPKLESAIAAIKGMGLLCHLSEVHVTHSPGQESSAVALIDRYQRVGQEQGADRITYWEN